MLSMSLALANHANLQCASLQDIALDTSSYLARYPNVASPDACCELCGQNASCTAYTIKDSPKTCYTLPGLSHPSPTTGTLSGYTSAARVHYQE